MPIHKGEEPPQTKPILFEKDRLRDSDFANHIYTIKFKNKAARDMALSGYIHAILPNLVGIQSDMLHYGTLEGRKVISCVVKCTITLNDGRTISALGDGDLTDVPSAGTLVRTTETRSLKRAIARALDISKADFNNDGVLDEEEVCSPMKSEEVDDFANSFNKSAVQNYDGKTSVYDKLADKHREIVGKNEDSRGSDDW